MRIRDEAWLGERGEGVGDEVSRGLPGEAAVASDRRLRLSARVCELMLGRGGSGSSAMAAAAHEELVASTRCQKGCGE